jgi:hypothetical protein
MKNGGSWKFGGETRFRNKSFEMAKKSTACPSQYDPKFNTVKNSAGMFSFGTAK